MPFIVRQKVQISSEILPQIPNFASFSPFENEALSAVCITVTAVNLFYEVLPKQFEALGLYFSQGKKQVTAKYWVSGTVALFASNHTELADHFATNPELRQFRQKSYFLHTTASFRHFVSICQKRNPS